MLYGKKLARTIVGIWQKHADNLSGNTRKETSAPISQILDTFLHSRTECEQEVFATRVTRASVAQNHHLC